MDVSDPFAALVSAEPGWHFDGRGVSVSPEAIARGRQLYAALIDRAEGLTVMAAVVGGVFIETEGRADLLILIMPDGLSVGVHGLPGGEYRTFAANDPLLLQVLTMALSRR